MLLLMSLLACAPELQEETAPIPMPEVWGTQPAIDHDPAEDVVEYHLEASMVEIQLADGEKTEVLAYNGQLPGPLLQARVGDTLRVVFENQLDEATTIHWHGLRIENAMDGVPAVQDPVEPGETFIYEFAVEDAGSYWYHPHMRTYEQLDRGLYGLLTVHEKDPPKVDQERYFALDDMRLNDDNSISRYTLTRPDGRIGRYGNRLVINGQLELLTDTIRPGAVERWRLVNTASARTMWFSVDGASMRIVGTDGGLLPEPYESSRVQLPVGQRYDIEVIVDADAEAVQLQLQLPNDQGRFDTYPLFEAIVEGEPSTTQAPDWSGGPLPEIREAEQEIELILDLEVGARRDQWTINGDVHHEENHEHIHVIGNTPTHVILRNESLFEHPFHLHGQFFQILSRDGEDPKEPGLKDTVLIAGEQEIVLYSEFENPGVWMVHCHILEHGELGMMIEMDVTDGTDKDSSTGFGAP
ncbi:MAG: multicopper oxidase family protein [Myxococcota bacterium]|nr:multicopper oxidase family protein [Myxococcota bacterium]